MRCADCKFWPLHGYQPRYAGAEPNGLHGYQGNGSVSDCRVHAPVADTNREDFMGNAVWPTTRRDHWCGEFEAREQSEGAKE